jgi:glutaredoxin
MKLYVCWGTFQTPRPPHGHPCAVAHSALKKAGYDPEVVKVQGLGIGPKLFQLKTDGRREVEELTGSTTVPVLVLDDGEVITESQRIKKWAEAHPAPVPA